MAHPPNVREAHPPTVREAQPPQVRGEAQPPVRGTAWSEGVVRLRAGATTEPGRLRIIGALVAVLVVAFGAVAAWEVSGRATAADDVVSRSQPLSADAARIYRSLADADTAASSGFLEGAQEPRDVLTRYNNDVETASELLVKAAANTDSTSASGHEIATLNKELPRYTGLIERARANNRQGLPLGGAYLRYANDRMVKTLLPAAERLYQSETRRLGDDYDAARVWPFAGLGLGVLALGGLIWVQHRNYRRTNRVFNHGLLAASVASAVVLLWLGVGHAVSRAQLNDARTHGQVSLEVLNDARINSLKARANENLTLVARGAVLAKDGKRDLYESQYAESMKILGERLGLAGKLADDVAGSEPVEVATKSVGVWRERHVTARATDDSGDFESARLQITGDKKSTDECFDAVDAALDKALAHEQAEFTQAADDGRGALTGLPLGAAVLALLGAAGAVLGIGRRLSEYR